MNRLELIAKLNSIRDVAPLGPVVKQAAELLDKASDVKIVIGEGDLPVEHFQKIGQRRLSRCRDLGHHIVGLEETVQSLASTSGNLRSAYAESGRLIVQFFLDNDDVVKGCVIAENAGVKPSESRKGRADNLNVLLVVISAKMPATPMSRSVDTEGMTDRIETTRRITLPKD